jgi:hypothetical protein
MNQPYYWRIDESSSDGTITKGNLWTFTVADFLVVDDFEDYNDSEPDRIFDTWIDGFNVPTNGSQVGYDVSPFAEQTIVHGGEQSMPLRYDNSTASFSEATVNVANLPIGRNWTKYDIKALTLWFHGDPCNVTQQMYVKINGTKVPYDDDMGDIRQASWHEWNIELARFGVNQSNVTEMVVGLERSGAAGGMGVVYFDDIRLYPPRCVPSILKPVADLNNDCVVDYFDLDIMTGIWLQKESDIWDAGGGHDGSSCLAFGDYVAIEDLFYNSTGLTAVSVSTWIRTNSPGDQYIISFDRNEYYRLEINGYGGGDGQVGWDLMTDSGQLDYGSVRRVDDDQWHHVVGVFDSGTATIYIDGTAEPSASLGTTYGSGNLRYGFLGANSEAYAFDTPTPGGDPIQRLDDIRVYDYALSAADVTGLFARTAQPAIGPILWYKLDETSGQIANDSSGNGYTGHLRGFVFFDTNLYQDTVIDFKDYAALAEEWLVEQLWPLP